jgi:predicted nucleic acid-binding protein
MKRLYLDICTYCRPFDDQNFLRLRSETDAFYLITQHIKKGLYQAVVSPVHFKEVSAITSLKKRVEIQALLNQGNTQFSYDADKARQRADELHALKFGVADAAHVAYAEQIADVFITCDDKLLKKCKKTSLSIVAMNPIEFIVSEDLQ